MCLLLGLSIQGELLCLSSSTKSIGGSIKMTYKTALQQYGREYKFEYYEYFLSYKVFRWSNKSRRPSKNAFSIQYFLKIQDRAQCFASKKLVYNKFISENKLELSKMCLHGHSGSLNSDKLGILLL